MNKTLPLTTRSSVELLPIGTHVNYHHRAGVARFKKPYGQSDQGIYSRNLLNLKPERREEVRGWILVEGTLPGPELVLTDSPDEFGWKYDRAKDMFFNWPRAAMHYPTQKVNKTIMVWPSNGNGWIIGIIRKSIGESSPGYRSSNGYGEEYEQGYHQTDMYIDLYVVKIHYEGTDYILCPLWAVLPVAQ